MRPFFALSIISALIACHAYAELTPVREYLLKPPRDRRTLFAMAVTPEQDVLSFVANDDGTWRLSRVRHWTDKQPLEEALTVPGLVNGRAGWSKYSGVFWSADMFVTPDSQFVACIISAYPKGGGNREDLVSVVSLSQFRLVSTLHPSAVTQLDGNYRSYRLDRRGYLVINASTPFPRHPGDDPFFGGSLHRLAILTLPGLDIGNRCEYSEWMRSGSVVRRENESDCATVLRDSGSSSLDEFSKTLLEAGEVSNRDEKTRPPECAFLTYDSRVSRDGRFRRDTCTDGHRGFFGNFVVSHAVENVFLVRTGQKLGFIKQKSDNPALSRFATIEDRDYLLLMEGGTRLTVYQIKVE